jgi:hypothetical protein
MFSSILSGIKCVLSPQMRVGRLARNCSCDHARCVLQCRGTRVKGSTHQTPRLSGEALGFEVQSRFALPCTRAYQRAQLIVEACRLLKLVQEWQGCVAVHDAWTAHEEVTGARCLCRDFPERQRHILTVAVA